MTFNPLSTPGTHRTQIRGLIVRIRDGAVLAKTPDVEYAKTRLDRYGDAGTVEVRPCTAAEAQAVEKGARPGSGRRSFPRQGPKRQSPNAKLTDDQVREVRTRLKSGEPRGAIALTYDVKEHVIDGIAARRAYTNVS